jgi:hypothetical protein
MIDNFLLAVLDKSGKFINLARRMIGYTVREIGQ